MDALRRRQRFLDRHLHAHRAPAAAWTDFPPTAILSLLEMPPLGNPIWWNGRIDYGGGEVKFDEHLGGGNVVRRGRLNTFEGTHFTRGRASLDIEALVIR